MAKTLPMWDESGLENPDKPIELTFDESRLEPVETEEWDTTALENPYEDEGPVVIADLEDEETEEKESAWSVFKDSYIVDEEGEKVNPTKLQAYMYGIGYEGGSIFRGIKQFFGFDEETLERQRRVAKLLWEDPVVGGAAKAGAITGMLIEPVGLLIPVLKGKKAVTAMAKATGIGALYGGALYVEEGRSRLTNTLMGGVAFGTFTGAFRAGSAFFGRNLRKANDTLDTVEQTWAELMQRGISGEEIPGFLKATNPKLVEALKDASRKTGRFPAFPATVQEANKIVEHYTSSKKLINLSLGSGVDNVVGIISTRLGHISPKIKLRVRNHERRGRETTHKMLNEVDPFLRSMKKQVAKKEQPILARALANGDMPTIERILKGTKGEAWNNYLKVKTLLDEVNEKLIKVGRITEGVHNYFPRILKDRKGLLKAMGAKEKNIMDKALSKARDTADKRGYALSPAEESEVINRVVQGFGPRVGKGSKPGFTKPRTIENIPEEWMKFYENPEAALHTYVRNAATDLEKIKFFGEDISYMTEGATTLLDVNKSVGSMMQRELAEGRLTTAEASEIGTLLQLRFGIGEKPPAPLIQHLKNILYTVLLANPLAATTQLGDIAVSTFINDFLPTVKGLVRSLTGTTKQSVKEMGMVDHLAEEFASTTFSAKILNMALKYGGLAGKFWSFSSMDILGKNTFINAAWHKARKIYKPNGEVNVKNMKKLSDKYAEAFGADEFKLFISEIKSGEMSERVKLFLFSELSDVQPISLSEMPAAYLKSPNGRLLYTLKTFMLRQMDILRREGIDEINKGNTGKGVANILRYGMLIGAGNAGAGYVKDMMLGRDVEPEVTDIATNFIKTFGWSEYTSTKAGRARLVEIGIDYTIGPLKTFDKIMQLDPKALRYMPVYGRLYYEWFGGGMEEYAKKQRQKKLRRK